MSSRTRHGVVLDFDGTITVKAIGSLFKVVDTRALPPEAEKDFKTLRDRYIPLAHDGMLAPELQMEWLAETFEIYIRYGLTRAGWMEAIAAAITFRAGALETLEALHASGVPTAVISYGSTDFIEHALVLGGAEDWVSSIHATRMCHDADGRVIGYDRSTFVTQDNKGDWSRRFADDFGIPPENLLAVGDTLGDYRLGYRMERRFGLAENEKERAKMAPYMGEIAIADDFGPARAWLARQLGLPL